MALTAQQSLEIETLLVQRTYELSRLRYFNELTSSLPGEVTIVFENKEGRVKMIDINKGEAQLHLAGYHIKCFAVSMASYHNGRLEKINQQLQSLNFTQD